MTMKEVHQKLVKLIEEIEDALDSGLSLEDLRFKFAEAIKDAKAAEERT